MSKITITYNNTDIAVATGQTSPVAINYNGSTIATINDGETKTLACNNKYMSGNISAGGKTLDCSGKLMESNVSIKSESEVHIYGAEWNGSSTPVWTRTDESAGFADPVPALGGTGGSSPFDNCYPWNGMTVVEDTEAGTLVKIPKFYYKWTRDGASMKLQIADSQISGFSVSPAHQDKGDTIGERDVVYVGKYHCASDYKSKTGVVPIMNITRETARTSIHALGSTIWQTDYAMLWTIWMLYLVEFANWNSQDKIGYGCGNNSTVESMGQSDSMSYHTGTIRATRNTYGVGVKYRNIEDLWGNCFDWIDGIYFSGSTIYGIKNPANFSDSLGGTNIGTRPTTTSTNCISAWSIPSALGFEWALFPSEVNGSDSTYVCDRCKYDSLGVVLNSGGDYFQNLYRGLFWLDGFYPASRSNADIGCRLQKLP